MKRIDIVRQQRAIPLLNELLFSVIDSKPDDPLEFLIDALERITTDVKQAKGRLAELVRGRKQLSETLTAARRHQKPAGLTLLLHASGGAQGATRHPLLHEMYHNDALLHAPPPALPQEDGSDTATTVATGNVAVVHVGGVILPPIVAEVAAPPPPPHPPMDMPPTQEDVLQHSDDNTRRMPTLHIQSALSGGASWELQVQAALKAPMPTEALQALYATLAATRERAVGTLDGVEVLLVSAVHNTASLAVTPNHRSGLTPRGPIKGIDSVHVSPAQVRKVHQWPLLQLLTDTCSDDSALPNLAFLVTSATDGAPAQNAAEVASAVDYTHFQPLDFLRLACDVSSVAGHFSALEVLFQTSLLSRHASGADSRPAAITVTVDVANVAPPLVAHSLAAVAAAASHPLPYLDFLVAASQQPRSNGAASSPTSSSGGSPAAGSGTSTAGFSNTSHTSNITRHLTPFVEAAPSSYPYLGRLLKMLHDDAGSATATPYLGILAALAEELMPSDASLLRLLVL